MRTMRPMLGAVGTKSLNDVTNSPVEVLLEMFFSKKSSGTFLLPDKSATPELLTAPLGIVLYPIST